MRSSVAVLLAAWSAAASSAAPAVASHPSPAADPLAAVEELLLEGRPQEALAAVRQAQRTSRLRKDRRHEALSLLLMAAAEVGTGDLRAAASDFERSAELFETQGDRFSAWMALWPLGLVKRIQKGPTEALAHHRRALALLQAEASAERFAPAGLRYLGRWLEMPPDLLRVFRARPEAAKPTLLRIAETMSRRAAAEALLDTGSLKEAEVELSRAGELSDGLGGMFSEELAINRGDLQRRQGRLDEARATFHKALGAPSLPPARTLEVLGFLIEVEIASGRHDEALVLSDRALTVAARSGEPAAEFFALVLRARSLALAKQSAVAEDALTRALGLAREAANTSWQALVHKQLAWLALRAEQLEKAMAQLESAVQLFQTADAPKDEGQTWLELAIIYARLDSRASANSALEKARALSQRSGSPLLEAWVELLVAAERLRTGQGPVYEVSERLMAMLALPEVREIVPREEAQLLLEALSELAQLAAGHLASPAVTATLPEKTRLADLQVLPLFVQGYAHYQRGELAAARGPWLAALGAAPRHDLEVALLTFVGFSYGREGRDHEAIDHLTRAVAAVERTVADVRLEEFVASYLGSDKQVLFANLIELLVRQGRPADAFGYAERARARGFLQGLGSPRFEPAHADAQLAADVKGLRAQIQDWEQRILAAPAGERARLSADLRRARERYQSLLLRLKVTGRGAASPTHPEPRDLQTVREELAPDTSLVSYFVSPSQVHAWVLDKETFRHLVLPAGAEDLRTAACWVDELSRQGGDRGARPLDPRCGGEVVRPGALYEKLVAPLRDDIQHRRLIVIPHGELHYLPFAALRDPKTGRFLLEDYTLTYAPSASAVGLLRQLETPLQGRALILGEPEELDPALIPLPAARREAEIVARLLSTRALLGAEATEHRLSELSGEVDLLHIAAHGIYDPANPLFSRIVLAPGGGRDGNLEVHEILADMDLSGVNLVVLSACRTAVGERSSGDEVVGLTRALLDAGSPGVISTLWDIDDEAAAVLMEELYRRLVAGTSAAEALREAQLALLRGSLYREPRFWAAFSLTGDPQGRWPTASP